MSENFEEPTSPPRPASTGEWDSDRITYAGISIFVAIGVVVGINILSGANEWFAENFGRVMVDYQLKSELLERTAGPNYFAPQNFMWIAFFFGIAELCYRYRWIRKEARELEMGYLPEDDRTLLKAKDLPPIYKQTRLADRRLCLPRLVQRIVIQFQKSNSVEQSSGLLNSSLDLFLHELDLRYTVIRYTNWVIPTLGFLGTVIGIANALSFAGSGKVDPSKLLQPTTMMLGVAFYTTLIALILSGILVLGMNLVQAAEERLLNRSGQYCLENLINKLYAPPS